MLTPMARARQRIHSSGQVRVRVAILGGVGAVLWLGHGGLAGAELHDSGPSKVIGISEAVGAMKAELREVSTFLTGSFSSAAQAARDSEFLSIVLHMVPIWVEREDGPWLYVEQSRAGDDRRPYRQRVYRLVPVSPGVVRIDVYTLPGATPDEVLKYAGAWSEPTRFKELTPERLALREGCSLTLTRTEQPTPDGRGVISWRGATAGKGCVSELHGAAYATSEAVITEERLVTLDRGFDAQGRQVWGPTRGGYEFVRLTTGAEQPAPSDPKAPAPAPTPPPTPVPAPAPVPPSPKGG
jgi:CpeT protein